MRRERKGRSDSTSWLDASIGAELEYELAGHVGERVPELILESHGEDELPVLGVLEYFEQQPRRRAAGQVGGQIGQAGHAGRRVVGLDHRLLADIELDCVG